MKYQILLVSFWNFDFMEKIAKDLQSILLSNITILEKVINFNAEYRNHHGNLQYSGKDYLPLLQSIKNEYNSDYILGIENKDLYVTNLNFIFGLASSSINTCIISVARLRTKDGSPSEIKLEVSNEKFYSRVLKEAVHELGHTIYDLKHCSNPNCVMYFSNTLSETDMKSSEFCKNCRGIIERKEI